MQKTIIDHDLLAIQQARLLSKCAKSAYKVFSKFSQDHVDNMIDAMAKKTIEHPQRLVILAFDQTGYGNAKDKTAKNIFAAKNAYDSI
jgi:acetaldehyde dehydrogenase (acetylating)